MDNKLKKDVFKVDGMTCIACEARVEKKLKQVKGIRSAKASFSNNRVEIDYETTPVSYKKMANALEEEGYTLLQKQVTLNVNSSKAGKDQWSISQFVAIVAMVVVVYLIVQNTVGFDFIPEVTQSTGYGVLFVVGLLTSLHCVAMCGGINISQCVSYARPGSNSKSSLIASSLYNGGRVISYTVIGGIVGTIGSVVSFSGWARGLIAVIAGVFMLLMSISMLGIFPYLNKFIPRMPKAFRIKALSSTKNKGPLYVGLINGLMPCGPLQAMQLYALGTGSFLAGALSMFFFSLGTVPLMFGIGVFSTMFGKKFTKQMFKISAALVLVLGIIMINRGLALSGVRLIPSSVVNSSGSKQTEVQSIDADKITILNVDQSSDQSEDGNAVIGSVINPNDQSATSTEGVAQVDGTSQVVYTTLSARGYPELTVQAGVPVVWHLKADENAITGCNNTLIVPAYNLQVRLQPGDNVIEFTPDGSGTVPFSCWMGMIQSQINVVETLEGLN